MWQFDFYLTFHSLSFTRSFMRNGWAFVEGRSRGRKKPMCQRIIQVPKGKGRATRKRRRDAPRARSTNREERRERTNAHAPRTGPSESEDGLAASRVASVPLSLSRRRRPEGEKQTDHMTSLPHCHCHARGREEMYGCAPRAGRKRKSAGPSREGTMPVDGQRRQWLSWSLMVVTPGTIWSHLIPYSRKSFSA